MKRSLVAIGAWLSAGPNLAAQSESQTQQITEHVAIGAETVRLHHLNAAINRWLILEVLSGAKQSSTLHLETADPRVQVTLSHSGLRLNVAPQGIFRECHLWEKKPSESLVRLGEQSDKRGFLSLCDGLISLRHKRPSDTPMSNKEWLTDALRKTPVGEDIINFLKPMLVSLDIEKAVISAVGGSDRDIQYGPLAAKGKNGRESPKILDHSLGINIESPHGITSGRWYPSRLHKQVYVSLASGDTLADLDPQDPQPTPREGQNLVYLTAYDLSRYQAHYVLGATHPAIQKSEEEANVGISQASLVPIGTIPPRDLEKAVGVFIGGFKAEHGRLRFGPHKGKEYGYVQGGVALKPLAPGLATIWSTSNGDVQIGPWPEESQTQADLRQKIVSARQNGVMLIDNGKPGMFVSNWGYGNWSGDAKGSLLTLRSAVCIQEVPQAQGPAKRYLLFAAFTGATPAGMVQILTAYGCQSAMQLDMNAYLYLHNALIQWQPDGRLAYEYLHQSMEYPKGAKLKRFIHDNNYRDFFYVGVRNDLRQD